MKDKSKKSTYSTTFGVDPKFVNKNKQIYLFIFTEVYEGMRRNPA